MRRLHLFEIGEQSWCPSALRNGLTDYLTDMIEMGQPYAAAAPLLTEALCCSTRRDGIIGGAVAVETEMAPGQSVAEILDLASGAAGPWRHLISLLAQGGTSVRVRLTDRFPNLAAYARLERETNGRITGEPRPVWADSVPADLTGFRTMFSAFHHFRPADARRVLADAVARREGIAIFEATRRDVQAVLLMCLTPLFVVAVTPFIRPFRWSRLLLTYIVPAIPLAVLFDGVVSCLRTYTPAELRALAEAIDAAGYTWSTGEVGTGPIPMTYLIGAMTGTR